MKIIKTFPFAKYLQLAIDMACEQGTPEIVLTDDCAEFLGLGSNVLNVSGSAVRNFHLDNDVISFDCSVGGRPHHVEFHPAHVTGVNVREAEGYCVFPNLGNAGATFVIKSQAGEDYYKEKQEALLRNVNDFHVDDGNFGCGSVSCSGDGAEEEKEEGSSNVVSLSSRRKKD